MPQPYTDTVFGDFKEALNEARIRSAQKFLDGYIADSKQQITQEDEFNDTIAETNASGWDIDDYTIDEVEIDEKTKTITANISFSASGENDQDKPFVATQLNGTATATISDEGKVSYKIDTIELDRGGEDEEEGEEG